MEKNAKDYILTSIKKTIDDLQERKFDSMKRLVNRLHSVGEIFPDDVWTKELDLACITMIVVGASSETEITRMKKEEADSLIKSYTEKLNDFYTAIEEENIAKTDIFLKEFVNIFFKNVGL